MQEFKLDRNISICTKKLEENGFSVLRFWNNDFLKERTNVLAIIYDALIKS